MSPEIRPATRADAAGVAAIYNWYIENTVVTFEVEAVSADEMARRIESAHDWLVLERGGELLGYSYAVRYHARAAYRYAAESTIYLRNGLGGGGLGTRLYGELIRRSFARDLRSLIGGIALPNDASVRLHEKLGFEKKSHLHRIGFKFERWIDVGHWQLERGPV